MQIVRRIAPGGAIYLVLEVNSPELDWILNGKYNKMWDFPLISSIFC